MASNPRSYHMFNESINIKNILKYLIALETYNIIPSFTINITDSELIITTIYSEKYKFPLSGHTIIVYNIHTKKWKSYINLVLIINGFKQTIYSIFEQHYPYLIDNNLLKINYQPPYIEYVLESDYIEDILEPSLNNFINGHTLYRTSHSIDPYNILYDTNIVRNMSHFILNRTDRMNVSDVKHFYKKINENERRLLFESKMKIINDAYFLPEELWNLIYNKQPVLKINCFF